MNESELALTTSLLRRALSVVGVKTQARLLLGRLETIGPGAAAAAGRRNYAPNLERIWANERRADLLSRAQGKAILRRGQFRRDWSSKVIKKTYNSTRGAVRRQEDSSIPKCDNMYFRISIHLCFISTLFFNKRIKTSKACQGCAKLFNAMAFINVVSSMSFEKIWKARKKTCESKGRCWPERQVFPIGT